MTFVPIYCYILIAPIKTKKADCLAFETVGFFILQPLGTRKK